MPGPLPIFFPSPPPPKKTDASYLHDPSRGKRRGREAELERVSSAREGDKRVRYSLAEGRVVRGLLPLPPSLTHFTSRLYYYYVQYKRSLSPWSADENDRRYVKCVFGMCNFPPPRERSIVSPRTSASEPVLSLFFAKRAAYLADPLSR